MDLARKKKFYEKWGKKNWDKQVLYTPNTLFVREDSSKNYKVLDDNYMLSVILAAPDFRKISDASKIPEDDKYEKVIKQIYYAPIIVKDEKQFEKLIKSEKIKSTSKINNDDISVIDILILGAWGCGSFRFENEFERNNKTYNYSSYIAERFINVLSTLGGHYKKICFAIPQSFDKTNYDVFTKLFKENENNFENVTII